MFASRAMQPVQVSFSPGGIFALESHHGRGFRMADTQHSYLKFLLPIAGRGWLVRGETRTKLQQGDVAYVPPGCVHHLEDHQRDPLSLYALCMEAGVLARFGISSLPPALRRHWHFCQPAWGTEMRDLLRRILHEQTIPRIGSELLIPALAIQALVWLQRAGVSGVGPLLNYRGPTAEARVEAAAKELEHRFYEHTSLDEVAARTGVSRRRFTQLFRNITGRTWLAAVHHHRLTHARRLLAASDRSIVSIAFEAGFGDLSSFYRIFREKEGTSPLVWRRTHQCGASACCPK